MTEQHYAFAVAVLVDQGLRLAPAIWQVANKYHVSCALVEEAVGYVSV